MACGIIQSCTTIKMFFSLHWNLLQDLIWLTHTPRLLYYIVTNRYRILQIVWGGKVSWLQNSTVIRWKTLAVCPSRVTNFQTLIAPTRKEGFAERWSWNNQSTTKSTILIFCLTWPRMWPHVYMGMVTTSSTTSVVDEFETISCVWENHHKITVELQIFMIWNFIIFMRIFHITKPFHKI